MTIGSLFSGIGGLELGLERAGLGPVVWQAESDPFCRRVLEKHWPGARRYEDVREIDETAERPDIICGGFPCQDISLAGTGAGLAGERSGLWSEFARIVCELRPRFVVVENVSALLGRGLGDVLGDLATGGYDARWDCIPAQAVGAPHRRDRLFVVAWRISNAERHGMGDTERGVGDWRPAEQERKAQGRTAAGRPSDRGDQLADADLERQQVEREQGLQRERVYDVDGRHGQGWPPRPDDLHAWGRVQADSQPAICRVAHGIPRRMDRLRSLGNAVVPQVAEVTGYWIAQQERQRQ